ncbi:MAG: type I restriction enzyme HsdR N-terminal domain-containing protein [Odoribacteraceae bacterium]|nr:type I restriction enzyme HsdR N-terminal domain-containing protein [Odoribacteraceae bacterium]
MDALDFPPFDYRVKKVNGKLYIFDRARGRFVTLTPEEWVRQHLVHFLSGRLGYPERLIAVEQEIDVNGQRCRFDVVCHDRRGAPYLIVECKAPGVPLGVATLEQVFRYNHSVAARHVAITNGRAHLCGEADGDSFRLLPGFPLYRGED